MKKFLMMACMMLFSTAMFAQQGAMYLGGNLNYGLHSDYKNFGFGVKASTKVINAVMHMWFTVLTVTPVV